MKRVAVGADPVELPTPQYAVGWDVERRGFCITLGRDVIARVSPKGSETLLNEIMKPPVEQCNYCGYKYKSGRIEYHVCP